MKFRFIAKHQASYPAVWMCRRLGVSASGYYAWKSRPAPARKRQDNQLRTKVVGFHERSGATYGTPRLRHDFLAEGIRIGRRRIARLMQEAGIAVIRTKKSKRTTDSSHNRTVAPDLLKRNFKPGAPNTVWIGDITYVPTWEGWLYLAALLDLGSRRVVGYALADHMRDDLTLEALNNAIYARRPPPGLIHHSDRGSQYVSRDYIKAAENAGITRSMSRKGDCWDNAVAESFWASLKEELIHRANWPTRKKAEEAICRYIDGFYNSRRRHSTLGYVSPIDFELKAMQAPIAA